MCFSLFQSINVYFPFSFKKIFCITCRQTLDTFLLKNISRKWKEFKAICAKNGRIPEIVMSKCKFSKWIVLKKIGLNYFLKFLCQKFFFSWLVLGFRSLCVIHIRGWPATLTWPPIKTSEVVHSGQQESFLFFLIT